MRVGVEWWIGQLGSTSVVTNNFSTFHYYSAFFVSCVFGYILEYPFFSYFFFNFIYIIFLIVVKLKHPSIGS